MKLSAVSILFFGILVQLQAFGLSEAEFIQTHCQGNCSDKLQFERQSPDENGLTEADHYVIETYTQTYKILDQETFIRAVSKLPRKTATVYRGTAQEYFQMTTENDEHGRPRQIVRFNRISSTSTERSVADGFIDDQILIIHAKSARDISSYSTAMEFEHILLPGTKFQVDSIRSNQEIEIMTEEGPKKLSVQIVELSEI